MEPVTFSGFNIVYAKDQPQYRPLPAYIHDGRSVFCWRLSVWERVKLLWTGHIWQSALHFNGSLQPQLLQVERPDSVGPPGVTYEVMRERACERQ